MIETFEGLSQRYGVIEACRRMALPLCTMCGGVGHMRVSGAIPGFGEGLLITACPRCYGNKRIIEITEN